MIIFKSKYCKCFIYLFFPFTFFYFLLKPGSITRLFILNSFFWIQLNTRISNMFFSFLIFLAAQGTIVLRVSPNPIFSAIFQVLNHTVCCIILIQNALHLFYIVLCLESLEVCFYAGKEINFFKVSPRFAV